MNISCEFKNQYYTRVRLLVFDCDFHIICIIYMYNLSSLKITCFSAFE